MAAAKSLGTGEIPLKFAKSVSAMANAEFISGALQEKATQVTRDLLRFWFNPSFSETRKFNFHEGQRQAILNVIYLHEALKTKNVMDMYTSHNPELLQEMDFSDLKKDKYSHPKYAIKMATGTGKTWVMHAILIWQYLNAKYEDIHSGLFSKNFLLVAPGLIVYERLLDAYLGKEDENGVRNFAGSDFKKFEELFIPPAYKDDIFGFIQSSVAKKSEIGKKVTGGGVIAITNWHLLAGEENDADDESDSSSGESPLENPQRIIKSIMPITPGTTAGHSLSALDAQYFRGSEINYLANLPDLVVFNDEAHHLGEFKKSDKNEILEKKWQKALSDISAPKNGGFVQIDFSATPYVVTGSGQNRTRHFFPHIISDYGLYTAIRNGHVKTVVIDKRKEIASLPLDFKAERDEKDIIGLSEGQKVMIRAGLQKLKNLETAFVEATKDEGGASNKHPKMLVICEETKASGKAVDFLKSEGYADSEILEIHSDRKGSIPESEWNEDKQKLFNIDARENPKVIVSVLMLREGFDVNNICVIVPLRSSSSLILLEQIIGRGLRLMWREREYEEIKAENRIRLLDKKEEPKGYYDILSIVEHPAYIDFYNDLFKNNAAGETKELPNNRESILGDIIRVKLKEGFEKYDLYIPVIVRDKEEELTPKEISLENLEPFSISLEELKKLAPKDDAFFSEEITVKTRFGEYSVTSGIFGANSYNEYIAKLVDGIFLHVFDVGRNKKRKFPMMQVNSAKIAKIADEYIRHRLFRQEFDPFFDNNWRVLLLYQSKILQHIMMNVSKAIYELQNSVVTSEAIVIKRLFSEVSEMRMRQNFSLDVSKAIYEKIGYPSNKGGFEKEFIEFIDRDSKVVSFIKIDDKYHEFAMIWYRRDDGLLHGYYPDFLIRIENKIYVSETKAEKDLNDENVKQKKLAAIEWVSRINALKPENRMNCSWHYVLLGENTFYGMAKNGASAQDILEYAKSTKARVEGTLGDFLQKK